MRTKSDKIFSTFGDTLSPEVIFISTTIKKLSARLGVPEKEIQTEIQQAIDEAWATIDVTAKREQQKLFPEGKPEPDEFIHVLALLSQKNFLIS